MKGKVRGWEKRERGKNNQDENSEWMKAKNVVCWKRKCDKSEMRSLIKKWSRVNESNEWSSERKVSN